MMLLLMMMMVVMMSTDDGEIETFLNTDKEVIPKLKFDCFYRMMLMMMMVIMMMMYMYQSREKWNLKKVIPAPHSTKSLTTSTCP